MATLESTLFDLLFELHLHLLTVLVGLLQVCLELNNFVSLALLLVFNLTEFGFFLGELLLKAVLSLRRVLVLSDFASDLIFHLLLSFDQSLVGLLLAFFFDCELELFFFENFVL